MLGNAFYDAPFIEEPGLVTRIISNGPHCVSTFQTHQDSTNPPHQCSQLQAKLGSQVTQVSFPGSATFIREQNDTALGYWSFQEQAVIPACRLTPKSTKDVCCSFGTRQAPLPIRYPWCGSYVLGRICQRCRRSNYRYELLHICLCLGRSQDYICRRWHTVVSNLFQARCYGPCHRRRTRFRRWDWWTYPWRCVYRCSLVRI